MQTIVLKVLFVISITNLCCHELMAQKDTLPPPTMTSKNLITLDDYNPDAVYGSSYMEMMSESEFSNKRKTIFNRQGSKFILPALFITYGVSARFNQLPIRQFDFDINNELRKRVDRQYAIDDYLEVATPVLAYGLGFIPGIKTKHNFRDRTLIMATSLLVMEGMVYGIKEYVPVVRPGGWDNRSFPSGHTSVTMTAAHIMYKEYKDTSPWIGVGGYLMATTTGVFRMINNAHWFSDVIMGMGIGLLSAEIGYMMLPVWHSIFGIKDGTKYIAALPTFTTQSIGLGIVCHF